MAIVSMNSFAFAEKISRFIKKRHQRGKDLNDTTRTPKKVTVIQRSFIAVEKLDVSGLKFGVVDYLTSMYLSHRFDLMGTGWIRNSYDSKSLGLEGYHYNMNPEISDFDADGNWLEKILPYAHILQSQRIWKVLQQNKQLSEISIPSFYIPIDWQKDYKSGYRYNSMAWYKDQRKKHYPGADIKVPRELARMQHMPRLAACALFVEKNLWRYNDQGHSPHLSLEKITAEFRNQVLDFTATNPPRLGCNWSCTMDVAIRAANFLVAYDLFCQLDKSDILDNDFKKIFSNSIYEHGQHIINNLEWNRGRTTNHYLANICGLLFIAIYLERNNEIDAWLAFAVQEILNEIPKQFNGDGSNFEASTSYHRLSGEMIVYTSALILGLPDDKINALVNYNANELTISPGLGNQLKSNVKAVDGLVSKLFSTKLIEIIYRTGLYSLHLTKPNNRVPQIGDNDSGHFFNFSPCGEFISNKKAEKKYLNLKGYNRLIQRLEDQSFWDEDVLNHNLYLSALNGLFNDNTFEKCSIEFPLEHSLIKALARNCMFNRPNVKCPRTPAKSKMAVKTGRYIKKTTVWPKKQKKTPLFHNLNVYPYTDAGIFIFKSDRIHLTVSAGVNGQNGAGGHSHNDKLSFGLNIDGEDIFSDPGTYLYTPLPHRRNEFRSVKMHNTIIIPGQEQNRWQRGVKGLFKIRNEVKCRLLDLDSTHIYLSAEYRNVYLERKIQIKSKKIVIKDSANFPFKSCIAGAKLYSNGYGKLIRC